VGFSLKYKFLICKHPVLLTADCATTKRTFCREKAAKALKGIVGVGAVDADEHKSLGQEWGVQGFPTIKLMYTDASDKIKSIDYKGARTAKDIVEWAGSKALKVALDRLDD